MKDSDFDLPIEGQAIDLRTTARPCQRDLEWQSDRH